MLILNVRWVACFLQLSDCHFRALHTIYSQMYPPASLGKGVINPSAICIGK